MLFNSPEFIFLFLPLAVVLHFLAARWNPSAAALTTAASSLVFYLWWNPPFVVLPISSIILNYALAHVIVRASKPAARGLLVFGICANLFVLGYFKYAHFLAAVVLGRTLEPASVPLALSFTTFVQIAFLVDVWRRRQSGRFDIYAMFVAFFPHLIAGPIVRWSELAPQLEDRARYRVDWTNISLGLTIFLFGLAKKTVLADQLSEFVAPVFDAVAHGEEITLASAWAGAFAYSCQLYFDFSGYSEMAIGLGLLFNFRLPINFAAPFRATSIVDLWRRWHVSLSRFLRDFVYLPLGGSRGGTVRTALNLFLTMVLGGLWHGAGWTFIAWGAFHGVLLSINHAWRTWRGPAQPTALKNFAGWLATFVAFAIGMVFFRASDLPAALLMLKAMVGWSAAVPPDVLTLPWDTWGMNHGYLPRSLIRGVFGNVWSVVGTLWLAAAVAIALFAPEIVELTDYREGEPHSRWRRVYRRLAWRTSLPWLIVVGTLFVFLFYRLNRVSEFLYYQF